MPWLIGSGALLLALIALLLAFTYWQAARLVHPTRKPLVLHPRNLAVPHEEVVIASPVGKLAAWYLPGTNGRTLIGLHGINDNKEQWLAPAADLQRRGYNVLLLDFRGHGQSEGRFVTFGDRETEDVRAVLTYLQSRGDVDLTRIGLMGLSLGAITAIIAAARLPEIRAVVAEAAFGDLKQDLGIAFHRFTGLPPFPFANLVVFWGRLLVGAKLSQLRPVAVVDRIAPRAVFIIGDLKDNLVDEPQTSAALFAQAGEPKQLWQLPDVPHVGGYAADPVAYIDRIDAFFNQYL